MFRICLIFLLCTAGLAQAETPESLSQKNAFPVDIIAELDKGKAPQKADAKASGEVIRLGTIVALYRHRDNSNLYDFTISLPDNTVIIVTQDNELDLRPGDTVSLSGTGSKTLIKDRILI